MMAYLRQGLIFVQFWLLWLRIKGFVVWRDVLKTEPVMEMR